MPSTLRSRALAIVAAASIGVLSACGGDEPASSGGADGGGEDASQGSEQAGSSQESDAGSQNMFPDIVEVDVNRGDENTASFAVTVSSPYDTPQRYADGWRVLDQDGEVLGEHMLAHDHASEQPFTRTQSDVTIPDETTELTIEGRDQENGYGGETVTVQW